MGRWDAMVWNGWYLSIVWVRVRVGHVRRHVAMVLVIMRTCTASLLVHVGVVCMWWWHRVQMVGGVVCRGSLPRAGGVVG